MQQGNHSIKNHFQNNILYTKKAASYELILTHIEKKNITDPQQKRKKEEKKRKKQIGMKKELAWIVAQTVTTRGTQLDKEKNHFSIPHKIKIKGINKGR